MPTIPLQCPIVSVVAVRRIGAGFQVLLLQRVHSPVGAWCQIAGKIEENESAWQAALRELHEETLLIPTQFYSADFCEQFYEPARDAIIVAPVFVAFVDEHADVTLDPEHSGFRWVTFDEAINMVSFAGQRKMLRHIEAEFIQRAPSPHLLISLP